LTRLSGISRVESGEWRVESGEWRVESGEWRVESGEWRVEGLRPPKPEAKAGYIVNIADRNVNA
jgi:hypothetical protein